MAEAKKTDETKAEDTKKSIAQLEEENKAAFVQSYNELVAKHGLQIFPTLTLEVRKTN